MLKKQISRPFRRLQGKLTLSYTVATVMTFLVAEVLIIGLALFVSSFYVSWFFLRAIVMETPQAPPYFVHGTPDRTALAAWLQVVNADMPTKQGPFHFSRPTFIVVTDTQGRTITATGSQPIPAGTQLQAQLSPQNRANLQAVLGDRTGTTSKVAAEADGQLVAIAAIMGPRGNVVGALVMKNAQPGNIQLIQEFAVLILFSAVVATAFASVVGSVAGYVTARGLVRRLKGLSNAANKWSHGDFSTYVQDTSEDELGQTTQQLNHMAAQLQNLLQARQKLATLEERNRLARDLHDSVKQQVFAVSMQIGATKLLLRRDTAAAEVRLLEAEKLVRQAQQELTSLVRELRPAALEGKRLVTALRELVTQWTQQTDIVANLRVDGSQTIPLTVEEALFRVAQEALSNVARHSKADLVQMILTITDDTVTLSVNDNGQGFDTTRQGYLGVGLLSMQERMKALGGDVSIESTPEKGTPYDNWRKEVLREDHIVKWQIALPF